MFSKYLKIWYLIFALLSIVLAFYTIAIHVKFTLLPVFFIFLGFTSYLLNRKKALYLFVFLLPLINSLPDFSHTGYAFNFMALILFYLSGFIVAGLIKGEMFDFSRFSWSKIYIWFLAITWISAFFIFLKWSNVFLSWGSFMSDTPVAPGNPAMIRTSFASIYPVATLFLFSVSPFIAIFIKENKIEFPRIYQLMVAGFSLSFGLAIYQKLVDADFLALAWWGNRLNQYNGGFSDFNAFGFFAGFLFLFSALQLVKTINSGDGISGFKSVQSLLPLYVLIMSFTAVLISGSRTAFIFILAAVLFLFFNRKLSIKFKFTFLFLVLLVVLISGSVLEGRLKRSINLFVSSFKSGDIVDSLDKASNGRIRMIIDSIPIIKRYPVSGIGSGNFLFYHRYLRFGDEFWEDLPLNQYLLIQNETGIIGLVLFILFMLFMLYDKLRDNIFRVIAVTFLVLLVNNFFWFPEILLLFWILSSFLTKGKPEKKPLPYSKTVFLSLILVFIIGNILSFRSLRPHILLKGTGLPYDYGFWQESVPANFKWTKDKAGFFLKLNQNGESEPMKIYCGAPVHNLENQKQMVKLYWQGKLFEIVEFRENTMYYFQIKGVPGSEGFLTLEVKPTFNLNKMGLGRECRDLGVKFFFKHL